MKRIIGFILMLSVMITTLYGCNIEKPSNVILIIFDALRYDGIENGNMTYLKELSENGYNAKCIAGGNRTFDGFNTILTGKYVDEIMYDDDLAIVNSEELITEKLHSAGYATMFVSACVGDAGFEKWNYQQGCDIFENYEGVSRDPWYCTGDEYVKAVENNLRDLIDLKANKNFIVIHIADMHEPYSDIGDSLLEKYYNSCSEGEATLKKLMTLLEKYNFTNKNTDFLITSDHGEQLGEYGEYGHGHTLNDEEVIVPLIIYGNGVKPVAQSGFVSHLDLYPTILSLCSIDNDANLSGVNLLESNQDERRTLCTKNLLTNQRGVYEVRNFQNN